MFRASLCVLAIAACGGDDSSNVQVDAPSADSTQQAVQAVTCPGSPDATVTSSNTSSVYAPAATTVPVGGIVKFAMASTHNVAPNTLVNTDPGLSVGFGETKCLKFNKAGTFGFFCTAHSFTGTITVQ